MDKIKYIIIAWFLILLSVTPVMAFPTHSLTQVVYNETDNEVFVNLGLVPEIDFSAQNVILAQAGTVNLGQFTSIDSWNNLNLAFFASRTSPSPRQSWFALTKDTISGISSASLLGFGNSAAVLYTLTGNGSVYVGLSNNVNSYDVRMNSASNSPGYYGGFNGPDRIYGEANLGALYTDGYVDMYLYHYSTITLDPGADPNTQYTAILRFNIDGSTILNPIVDKAPTVANPISDVTVDEDSANVTVDLASVFTDNDNDDTLITKAVNSNSNPSLVTASISSNILTLFFQPEQSGSAEIVIRATSNSKTVDDTFTVTVTPFDDPPVVANPISDISVDEDSVNVTINLASVFTDIDNDDALITKAVNSNSNPGLVNATISGNTLTLSFLPNQYGNSEIVIRVTSNGKTVDDTFTVTVTPVDDAPVVANPISDVTVDEDSVNVTINLTSVFTDNDNDDALITKAVNSNSNPGLVNAAISGNTLSLNLLRDQHGSAVIVIRATSNGRSVNNSFTVSVTPLDDAPAIANPISDVTVDEDSANITINLTSVFTDVDNDDGLITKAVNSNSNPDLVTATISENTLTLAFLQNQNGNTEIVIRATSNGKTIDDTFTVTVQPVNDIPVISGSPATVALQGQEYSFTPTASDVDTGDTLVFSIANKPAWADFNATSGRLSGTPALSDIGAFTGIVISVTDNNSAPVSLPAFNITVVSANEPPTISGSPAETVNEDSTYSFTPAASDPNNNPLAFTITNKPAWAIFDPDTGRLSGTPTNVDVGTTSNIIISVTDNIIATPVYLPAFSITVINTNDAPVISGVPAVTVYQGAQYSFMPQASDVDAGDVLTFSITNKPTWAAFNTSTGALTGVPANSDVGITTGIVISVNDAANESASLPAFNLTVVNVNDPPTISGSPALTVMEDSPYSFIPAAIDIDIGDILTFGITNKPTWASFDSSTGALTGTPDNDDVGITAGIIISVTDNNLSTASLPPFSIEVVNVNDAPVVSEIDDMTILSSGAFSAINLNEYVEDVDNTDSEITWTYTGNDENLEIKISGSRVASISVADANWYGTQNVTFTATDPEGATDSVTITFTVIPAPPTVPGVNSPADGSETKDNPPDISINNSDSIAGDVTYDFELATDQAFMNIVAYNDDIPEGEGVTIWRLDERFPDLTLDENRRYFWRARAYDGISESGWVEASFIVNEFDEAPSRPGLSSPGNNTKVSSLKPVLEITNSTDPDNDNITYRFEIFNSEPSGNIPTGDPVSWGIVNQESDGTTSWVAGSGQGITILNDNTQYWWRARAIDADNISGEWAGFFSFTVNLANVAPTRPEIDSPVSNSRVDSYTPLLTVINSIDEDYGDVITYTFQVDTQNSFNSEGSGPVEEAIVKEGSNGKTSWRTSELMENTKYHWRVKASDGSAESSWISSSFTVDVVNEPPAMPVLRYPDDNTVINSSGVTLKANSVTDPDGNSVFYLFELCISGGECRVSDQINKPEWTLTGLINNKEYTWGA
jgi:plastocyanin